jgi:hypothetical protein
MPPLSTSQVGLRHPGWLFLALLSLTACGAESTDSSRLLLGEWGSSSALMIASATGAELRFQCSAVLVDNPIDLSDSDSFEAVGRLQTSSALIGSLPKVRLRGKLSDSTVTVTSPSTVDGGAVTYHLRAGTRPEPLEATSCPL